jgi:hypothetical protein
MVGSRSCWLEVDGCDAWMRGGMEVGGTSLTSSSPRWPPSAELTSSR